MSLRDSLRSPLTDEAPHRHALVIGRTGRCVRPTELVLGPLVGGLPTDLLSDGASHDLAIDRRRGHRVVPDRPLVAGAPVSSQHIDAAAAQVRDFNPSRQQRLPYDLGSISLVALQRLAGPLPRDQDSTAAAPKVLDVVRLRGEEPGRMPSLAPSGWTPNRSQFQQRGEHGR